MPTGRFANLAVRTLKVATVAAGATGVAYSRSTPENRNAAGGFASTMGGVAEALTWRSLPPADYKWKDSNRERLNATTSQLTDHDGLWYNPAVQRVNYQMDRRGHSLDANTCDAIEKSCIGRAEGTVDIIDAHRGERAGFYKTSGTETRENGASAAGAVLHTAAVAFLLGMVATTPPPHDPSDGPMDI